MSDPIESNEYLSPAFDAQTLRVAELRRIFFEHNIDFKSAAKKAELVQIFNDEVRPQASDWLKAKQNPAPSANKIESVGQSSPPPPAEKPRTSPTKTPGKRATGRPRKHALQEDDELVQPAVVPPSTAKKGPGRPRKMPKTESDEEGLPVAPSTVRKTPSRRKTLGEKVAAAPPTMETDEEMTDVVETPPVTTTTTTKARKPTAKKEKNEAVFSSDNPFQSGSPPPLASPTKRRQTVVPNSAQKLAPPLAKEPRRKTEPLVPQSLSSPAGSSEVEFTFAKTGAATPKTPKPASAFKKNERFMPPISQLKASPAFQTAAQRRKENSLASSQLLDSPNTGHESAGEEVTREESALLPPARRRLTRKHQGPSTVNQILKWTSLLGLTAGSAYGSNWYRQEKVRAGYCGIDSDPVITHPGATGTEDLVNQVRPQCVPCPPHAVCSPGFRMTCEDEFQKVHSPLSFGGLFPVSPSCVPDTEKLRRIQIVADEIVETLRDRTASVECGYVAAPNDGHLGMSETEMKDKLAAKKSSAITNEQFDTLWDHAMEDVKTRDEIEISSR